MESGWRDWRNSPYYKWKINVDDVDTSQKRVEKRGEYRQMTKSELIEALKEVSDNTLVIASSAYHNDIYEVLSVMNLRDGVVYLELGK